MAAIVWKELAEADFVLFAYFVFTRLVGFRSSRSFPIGHNSCPARSDIEKKVSDFYGSSPQASNKVVDPVLNKFKGVPTLSSLPTLLFFLMPLYPFPSF